MTAYDVYKKGRDFLRASEVESPDFDAMEIFKFCFNINREGLIFQKDAILPESNTTQYFDCILERSQGRPLQYIIGKWSFMGIDFKVGEGVLIPRDDTEVLVNTAITILEDHHCPKILDLCAGSGTIALALAKYFPSSRVTAIEISDIAYSYLNENAKINKIKNIRSIKADVLRDYENIQLEKFDLIVSNPPYIPSDDINSLQKEVLKEPRIALDGGKDGLMFYRFILRNWKNFLNLGGCIAVEIGINQSKSVFNIFKENKFCDIRIKKDINGIDRVVYGKLK